MGAKACGVYSQWPYHAAIRISRTLQLRRAQPHVPVSKRIVLLSFCRWHWIGAVLARWGGTIAVTDNPVFSGPILYRSDHLSGWLYLTNV